MQPLALRAEIGLQNPFKILAGPDHLHRWKGAVAGGVLVLAMRVAVLLQMPSWQREGGAGCGGSGRDFRPPTRTSS